MARWTPERSSTLSFLLDEVVGTEEMVNTRRDYCKILDIITSLRMPRYFTGSKSEGLDLPDSDIDYMYDINEIFSLKVVQESDDNITPDTYRNILHLCTENVPPGFAILRCGDQVENLTLLQTSRNINGALYLSSFHFLQGLFPFIQRSSPNTKVAVQGPSIVRWNEYANISESGEDNVYSIHCAFWPMGAEEWIRRPREFGWPSSRDISAIVDFGCHVVPIGHSLSSFKDIEWRISFSIAERTLVWSFHHVQVQCYALMKIILKEYIKRKCTPQNAILCSYFIKTFLFWTFETTSSRFWRQENLRECVYYLLVTFRECIRKGVLSHYFFPEFNLLSIKLTQEARIELLSLYDVVLHYDIAIMKECKTLSKIWLTLVSIEDNNNYDDVVYRTKKANVVRNDECVMQTADLLFGVLYNESPFPEFAEKIITQMRIISNIPVMLLILSLYIPYIQFSSQFLGNRYVYKMHQLAHRDISADMVTTGLLFSTLLLKRGKYSSCLRSVYDIISIIPPYALYIGTAVFQWRDDSTEIYGRTFYESNKSITEKAKTAWLFHIHFYNDMMDNVHLAIQIELLHCHDKLGICVSPYVYAYFLIFLCYHKLNLYDERDRALQMLLIVVNDPEKSGLYIHHSYNIAGHCLLLAGKRDSARANFTRSFEMTDSRPILHKYNSAPFYLQNILWL